MEGVNQVEHMIVGTTFVHNRLNSMSNYNQNHKPTLQRISTNNSFLFHFLHLYPRFQIDVGIGAVITPLRWTNDERFVIMIKESTPPAE